MSGPREEDAQRSDGLTASTSTEPTMDYSQPFSVLNERLRPRFTTSERLYSSLHKLEDRQSSSLGSRLMSYQPTVLVTEPEPDVPAKEPEMDSGQEDKLTPDSGDEAILLPRTTCLLTELNLKDFSDDSSSTKSDEKDTGGELSSEGGPGGPDGPDNETPFQRGYAERSLPDLIKTGRPLGRRRTVGHVSQTLKEVRREVELSRRRSIKLKAQVDKLQERRDGPGWSQDRERVTEEVLSVLRLLFPLTEAGYSPPVPTDGANRLDAALDQLQKVARNLAVSHTAKQEFRSGKDSAEDSAVLQQALRDRDEAIEKKKAMEAELLRSRTEMMVLNNQVLEAAQRRLEMSLELEAWKEDFQLLLHQQVLIQQQAEQAPKKTSRLGILRRNNRPPIQRPTSFPVQLSAGSSGGGASKPPSPKPPSPGSPSSKTSPSIGSTWRDKLRRGKTSRGGDQDAGGHESDCSRDDDGFQVISLD